MRGAKKDQEAFVPWVHSVTLLDPVVIFSSTHERELDWLVYSV